MMVNLLFLVHFLTILAGLAHLNSNVQKFQRCTLIFIFISTALTHLTPNLKKFRHFAPSFPFYSCSFSMLPTYFRAASIFLACFGPQFWGKRSAEDLRGVGKSSDILNFIYQWGGVKYFSKQKPKFLTQDVTHCFNSKCSKLGE